MFSSRAAGWSDYSIVVDEDDEKELNFVHPHTQAHTTRSHTTPYSAVRTQESAVRITTYLLLKAYNS
jgi:hypothetical protein